MESLGITISVGEDRSLADEVYSLLGLIGFKKYTSYYPTKSSPWVYTNSNGNIMHCSFKADNDIEVDINQLRDLVVLKRNDKSDRNVIDPEWDENLYLDSNKDLFVFHLPSQKWKTSNLNGVDSVKARLKPIEKKQMSEEATHIDEDGDYWKDVKFNADGEAYCGGFLRKGIWLQSGINKLKLKPITQSLNDIVKSAEEFRVSQEEYLAKDENGEYFAFYSTYPKASEWIEVPEGAEEYRGNSLFYKNNGREFFNGENWNTSTYGDFSVLWQRDNPEELKSIGFDLGAEGGDEAKITTIENPLFPDFVLSEPVVENNDFNGLDKSEINHRVAKAFNVIRGTDLNEDDIHFLRQLIDSVTSHYWDRK